jgi:hypothetical protein
MRGYTEINSVYFNRLRVDTKEFIPFTNNEILKLVNKTNLKYDDLARCSFNINRGLLMNSFSFFIDKKEHIVCKCDDEWFTVFCCGYGVGRYYKCDQIDGLINFINDVNSDDNNPIYQTMV